MRKIDKFSRGMGIGGWLTNYKRFNVLPDEWRMPITIGDIEHFESYITERDIAYIASLGFDHIRLGFDQIVLEEQPFVYRELTFSLVEKFVGWCKRYGVRPVLNMHKAIGNYCDIKEEISLFDSEELKDRFVALWLELERRFASDNEIMFELLNEVRDIDPEKWNDLAERTVRELRALNKDRYIIVGSVKWNCYTRLKDLRLYDDDKVIYTFHIYHPHEFTHQRGVLQAEKLYYNRALSYPCDDVERYREFYRLIEGREAYEGVERIDEAFLHNLLQPAADFVAKHPDKILWNGEFGTIRHADYNSRVNYMRDVVSFCKKHDIPYCVWNYLSTPNDGNRFSLVDDDTRLILGEELKRALLGE